MSQLELEIKNSLHGLDPARISSAIASVISPSSQGLSAAVRFVSAAEMAELNTYKGGDGPTNVLAFVDCSHIDIAICRNVAATDAEIRGWGLGSELTYLCIHGCLHGLGFDHAGIAAREDMKRLEGLILDRLGINSDVLGT